MTTKYPVSGNQVDTSTMRRRRRGEGIALISVIGVLVLLTMIATPFLLTMRDSAARGETFLYGRKADAEAESLFEQVRANLVANLEHVERRRLDDLGQAGGASGTDRPPLDATPSSDTTEELTLPADLLATFNRVSAKEHRVWDVDIVDTQSLVNLNNCSYPILANILGRSEVTEAIDSTRTSIPVADTSPFPKDGGIVRIGTECIKYEELNGNELSGCERGYMASETGNGPAADIEVGDTVFLEACFQIATRPFRVRPDAWVRYTNVYQARSIADLGVAALSAPEFDRLRPFVTTWNGNAAGDGWANPQLVRNAITAGDKSKPYVQVRNPRYFGPGTMVRITDGVNSDYAVVTKIRGTDQILIAGDIRHDYQADQARVYCLARSPVNINTATLATLTHVFNGLRLRGKSSMVDERMARNLAIHLKDRPATPDAPESGIYRNWEDFTLALEGARDAGVVDEDGFNAVLLNALNANDSALAFSTVPFVFRSWDTYEVRATASILGNSGRELARRELRRVFEVSSLRSSTFVVETQDDFQNQIMKSRDAKWFATFPSNVNGHYDGKNIPPSEFRPFAQENRFPDTDRAPIVGDVRLAPGAFRYAGTGRTDRVHHFDQEKTPDGMELEDKSLDLSVDGPYSVSDRKLDLVETVDITGIGEDIELGVQEFAGSFWYRPRWDRGNVEQILFDYGFDEPQMNRVSLRYVPSPDRLVLACADATREQRSAEVVYEFEGAHTTWTVDEWYHIAFAVHGCSPDLMELFVDGEEAGKPGQLTRLQNSIPAVGSQIDVQVENAKGFPDTGVLLLRAPEGIELMEYSARSDNSFTVTRRKARSINHDPLDSTPRTHQEGGTVQLYGFAAPLLTDIKKGGATVIGGLGPWRSYRMVYDGDKLVDDANPGTPVVLGLGAPQPGGTGGGGGGGIGGGGSSAQVTIELQEWDTGTADTGTLDDLGPAGTRGIALIATDFRAILPPPDPNTPLVLRCRDDSEQQGVQGLQQSTTIGGIDIVLYQVGQTVGQVELLQRGLTLRHAGVNVLGDDGQPVFLPMHEFGDPDPESNIDIGADGDVDGFTCAFVPIGVIASGTNAEYLDPSDQEPQLGSNGYAYVQVDGEWIRYDTYDTTIDSPNVAFYRDRTLDSVASLIGGTWNLSEASPVVSQSAGIGGGSGGHSDNTPPGPATAVNDEANGPPEPPAGQSEAQVPVTSLQIAQRLDFRGLEHRGNQWEYRIANTIPADHTDGTEIIPAFAVVTGNNLEVSSAGGQFAYPGFDDLLTLRDRDGDDEQVRVQWGYSNWAALTAATAQSWQWDRPQPPQSTGSLRAFDSRAWTRVLKFPSGELPDSGLTRGQEFLRFGKKYDNSSGVTPATIDEVVFWEVERPEANDRPAYARLGQVPAAVAEPASVTQTPGQPNILQFDGITAQDEEFSVHLAVYDSSGQVILAYGVPIHADTYPADGGILRIDDELIQYGEFDAGDGKFSQCVRGVMGTEPQPHGYDALVFAVQAFPASRLTDAVDASSASYRLADASDFPDDGYLQIGDFEEIVGYTLWEQGGQLSGPLGRLSGAGEGTPTTEEEARSAGAIFRGRFGTVPQAYSVGDVAIAFPFRHYDRYAVYADDPEMSYVQLSWTRQGAVWKRIGWDEQPRTNIEVVALVRFSGGPPWDAAEPVLRNVGSDPLPDDDRRKYLYLITHPEDLNLLNVEADRIEVRFMVRFAKDAYDREAQIAPDEWKQTPWIRKVVVEYVAPSSVLSQE